MSTVGKRVGAMLGGAGEILEVGYVSAFRLSPNGTRGRNVRRGKAALWWVELTLVRGLSSMVIIVLPDKPVSLWATSVSKV